MNGENAKKQKELAKYLEIPIDEIKIEDEDSNDKYNQYYTPEGTFLVMNEEDSREAVKDDIESLMDDIGLDSFTPSFQETIIDKYMDEEWFKDYCKEDYEAYASDIETEPDRVGEGKYDNRLIQECIENHIITDEEINEDGEYTGKKDLIEELSTYLYERVEKDYDSYVAWYKFEFGNDSLTYLIKNNNITFDIEGITDACIEADGYGHFISSWDGETIELDTFYAYKQNEYDERN
jgi:hypothetical protein